MKLFLSCAVLLAAAATDARIETAFQIRRASARIDKAVFSRLEKLGMQAAAPCEDHVFVRRVFLDVIGKLPTLEETRQFLEDEDEHKRSALIDHLLERKEFADFQAMQWSDLLRVKSEFPINLWPNAAQAYYQWIWTSIRENKPYDRFVREMLCSNGSNFRVPPVNFYRALQRRTPEAIAKAVALTFMGVRADKWPKERLGGMAAFFSRIAYKTTAEWKEEIVYDDPDKAVTGQAAVFPDGTEAKLEAGKDPRALFADWLIHPKNPWFTRNIVNRVWYRLLGRGIIHEPDDMGPNNPARNPELLAILSKELISARYDLERLYRVILGSKVYQLSSVLETGSPEAEMEFACYPLTRLDAEVLVDALCQITGTREQYSSVIPEPFTFIPPEIRAVNLPDGSITSPFLEMFGRPPRDTGFESERGRRPTATQRLHLLNSSQVLLKLQRGSLFRNLLRTARGNARKAVDMLYLTILSRHPTTEELGTLQSLSRMSGARRNRNILIDLAWALLNSAEFQYRH